MFSSLFKKKKEILKSYSLIVYVPNYKYVRFFNNIFNKYEREKVLLISDSKINIKSISKNDFIDSSWGYLKDVLFPSITFTTKVLYQNFIEKKKKQIDLSSILHLFTSVLQSFFLINLRKKTRSEKILSLHPNGDLHFLLRMIFESEMHSIRPDTTSLSEEHAFIKSDFLYYKSVNEKKIYESFKLKAHILKSGYIYKRIETPKQNFNKGLKILFLDTCTNTQIESVATRSKAISDFYNVFSSNKQNILNVDHKFHPGLIPEEKKKTLKKLKTLDVNVVNEVVNIKDYDIVIGFYSTLFHDILCKGVSYIELTGQYDMYPLIKNSINESPILKIKSKIELRKIFFSLNNDPKKLYPEEIWEWYYKFYNIPNGKFDLKKNLSLRC